ncbi:MAG: cell shape-determining protein, partial [Arenibacter sp.]
HEIELKGKEHYEGLIEITKADKDIVPIFIKTLDGDLKIISSFSKNFEDINEGCKLVYLGKLLEADKQDKQQKN